MLAHAAWIASDLPAGELVCPIAVVEIGDSREVIPFEVATQEEAIRLGKQKVAELTGAVDRWAFAREGLWSLLGSDSPKLDVLSVTVWSNGLDEPLLLQQCFSPTAKGTFQLLDSIKIVVLSFVVSGNSHSALEAKRLYGRHYGSFAQASCTVRKIHGSGRRHWFTSGHLIELLSADRAANQTPSSAKNFGGRDSISAERAGCRPVKGSRVEAAWRKLISCAFACGNGC